MTTDPGAAGPVVPDDDLAGSAILMTWTSPVRGRAEAYLRWLDDVHIPEVRAAVPALRRSDRYTEFRPADPSSAFRHLVVHEFAARDITGVAAGIDAAVADGRIGLSPDLDLADAPPVQQWHLRGRRYPAVDATSSPAGTARDDPGDGAGAADEETR